jgi:hypothetical protein
MPPPSTANVLFMCHAWKQGAHTTTAVPMLGRIIAIRKPQAAHPVAKKSLLAGAEARAALEPHRRCCFQGPIRCQNGEVLEALLSQKLLAKLHAQTVCSSRTKDR